ncbi:arsenic resistance N-acetyltransferase ArsN2 [Mesorhizobium sp. YR577]|uniref:arsenic resistance N-acetyltransferase ArsN2 n=1 Tax=Mesorhizobium sp. YR577 TaxID=1884373 RepID=UPI0008F0F9FF|nr:arsenic resistance N-acetyltransferase ArsN2 [Mesorhizobium sp. YR577]SFU21144.1 amino-acid N-acetyltransferase [Mesorhizobium sp. YR577]
MTFQAEQVTPDASDFIAALEVEQLPTDDLAESGRLFFRFSQNGKLVGFGGIELCGENILLRSIVVLPQARGQGIGRLITESLLKHAAVLGAKDSYLLTTSATDFFEAIGFKQIQRDAVPPEILATKQASALCPSTATFLTSVVSNQPSLLPQASSTKEIIQ